jgi:hypothetical protein
MDEARRVLERLERIDALRGGAATTADLLAELRGLIADGERWLAAEAAGGTGEARSALERCRRELERPTGVAPEASL